MTMLFCTNKNEFHHQDRFNGVDYDFPPGQKVELSVEAATHMFGFGLKDKENTLTRLGWAMNYDSAKKVFTRNEDGVKRLSRFIFTEGVMVEKPVEEKPPEKPDSKTLHLKK